MCNTIRKSGCLISFVFDVLADIPKCGRSVPDTSFWWDWLGRSRFELIQIVGLAQGLGSNRGMRDKRQIWVIAWVFVLVFRCSHFCVMQTCRVRSCRNMGSRQVPDGSMTDHQVAARTREHHWFWVRRVDEVQGSETLDIPGSSGISFKAEWQSRPMRSKHGRHRLGGNCKHRVVSGSPALRQRPWGLQRPEKLEETNDNIARLPKLTFDAMSKGGPTGRVAN